MLISKPKNWADLANQLVMHWIGFQSGQLLLHHQQTVIPLWTNLVPLWNLLRLKSLPSKRNLVYTWSSSPRPPDACLSILLKNMENIVYARMQPFMGKSSDRSWCSRTWPILFACNCITMFRNFGAQPKCFMINQSLRHLTVCNALGKYKKWCRGLCFVLYIFHAVVYG